MLRGMKCGADLLSLEVLVERVLDLDINSTKEVFDGYEMKTNQGKLHLVVKEDIYGMEILNFVFM